MKTTGEIAFVIAAAVVSVVVYTGVNAVLALIQIVKSINDAGRE